MKKRYTRKQITEAIAYWQKRLNEAEDSAESFDSLKKRLDTEFAKFQRLTRNDVEKIKEQCQYADSHRYKHSGYADAFFGAYGTGSAEEIKLDCKTDFFDFSETFLNLCEDLVSLGDGNPEFVDEIRINFSELLVSAYKQDNSRCQQILSSRFGDNKFWKYYDDDKNDPVGPYADLRPDWKEGLQILREYAKKFYDFWVKKLHNMKYNVVFTVWNRSTLQQDVEAASEEEAKRLIFELHPEEYDMNRDIEIVSVKETT